MAKMHLPGEKPIVARPVRLRRLIGAFKSSELERRVVANCHVQLCPGRASPS